MVEYRQKSLLKWSNARDKWKMSLSCECVYQCLIKVLLMLFQHSQRSDLSCILQIMNECIAQFGAYISVQTSSFQIKSELESFNSVQLLIPSGDVDKMFPCVDKLLVLHRDSIVPELYLTLLNW